MSIVPWTDRQFSNAMRKAGWKNEGQGLYVHTRTNRKYYAWNYTPEWGEVWREWAARRQTPPL